MKHFNFDLYKESKQYFQLFDVYIKQFEKNKENVIKKESSQMGKKLECTTETEQFLKTYDDLSEDSQHFIRLILKIAHLISDDEFRFMMDYLTSREQELRDLRHKVKSKD